MAPQRTTECNGARAGVATHLFESARLRVTPRNVTGLLDALQADGLVAREAHPRDRRATLVSLTEKGRTVAAALRGGRNTMAAELFGDMPAEQLEAFQGGLEVVIERLRAMG